MASDHLSRRLALAGAVLVVFPVLSGAVAAGPQDDEDALIAEEREEADLLRRRGAYQDALALTGDLLEDDEEDALTLTVRARVRLDQGDLRRAEATAEEALEVAATDAERAAAGRVLIDVLTRVGRPTAAPLLDVRVTAPPSCARRRTRRMRGPTFDCGRGRRPPALSDCARRRRHRSGGQRLARPARRDVSVAPRPAASETLWPPTRCASCGR